MAIIKLARGGVVIIDDEDVERVNQYKWHRAKGSISNSGDVWYAQNLETDKETKKQNCVRMHRLIMKVPDGMIIDHINHDGLDNRKANLRICTTAENTRNARRKPKHKSRYKGVGWRYGRWRARIVINRKYMELGSFTNEDDAAIAYNDAAQVHHGEFAILNDISQGVQVGDLRQKIQRILGKKFPYFTFACEKEVKETVKELADRDEKLSAALKLSYKWMNVNPIDYEATCRMLNEREQVEYTMIQLGLRSLGE